MVSSTLQAAGDTAATMRLRLLPARESLKRKVSLEERKGTTSWRIAIGF